MISELVSEFRSLSEQLLEFKELALQQQPPCYFPLTDAETRTATTPLDAALAFITDVWYQGNQDGRETRSRHGIIMASDALFESAQAINAQKDVFRQQVNLVRSSLKDSDWLELHQQLSTHGASLREAMRLSGLGRLHLKQSYRHLPALSERPYKVGFSWYSHGRSIRKLSHQQAQSLLVELGEEKTHIQTQLQTLAQLHSATKLAQVQNLAPVVRANIAFGVKGETSKRQAKNVSLPLIIKAGGNTQLPEYNELPLTPPSGRTRQNRQDNRLSDQPILPSIRVFTYTDG